MALRKDKNSGYWFLDITVQGRRIKRSTRTKVRSEAQRLHDKVVGESWEVTQLDKKPDVTFDEAAVRFLKATAHQRDYETKQRHVEHFRQYFGGVALNTITTEAINASLPTTKTLPNGTKEPLSGATQNRYLATISRILHDAYKRNWIASVPYIEKRPEAPVREIYMDAEQSQKFLAAMPDGWTRDACEMALNTGMRSGEILSLEWRNVDLTGRVAAVVASKAKSKQSRPVPLNDDAMAVLERRKDKHKRYVFAPTADTKNPPPQIDKRQFKKAVAAAGLPEDFRFHDLRHVWASAHAQGGTPMLALQQLGGWKTLSMLNRYAHLSASDLQAYANQVQFRSRCSKSEQPEKGKKKRLTLVKR